MVVAEEGATEKTGIFCVVIVDTNTSRDINVVIQLHEQAAIAVTVKDIMCKLIPVDSAADEVGICLSALTGKSLLSCCVRNNCSLAQTFEVLR